MAVTVTNTDASLDGKLISVVENDESITGLKTFGRAPSAPFAVEAGSAVVPNLVAGALGGPRCSAYNDGAQSVSHATFTALALASEEFDVGDMHDNVTNNTRITIPEDGVYLVIGATDFAAHASGIRQLGLTKNGTPHANIQRVTAVGTSVAFQHLTVAAVVSLVSGDYVELHAYQESGGNMDVGQTVVSGRPSRLQVVRLF
jgi:hypothetical protein